MSRRPHRGREPVCVGARGGLLRVERGGVARARSKAARGQRRVGVDAQLLGVDAELAVARGEPRRAGDADRAEAERRVAGEAPSRATRASAVARSPSAAKPGSASDASGATTWMTVTPPSGRAVTVSLPPSATTAPPARGEAHPAELALDRSAAVVVEPRARR